MWQLIDRGQATSAQVWATPLAGQTVHSNFQIDPGQSVAIAMNVPDGEPETSWYTTRSIDAQLGGKLHHVQISEGTAGQRRYRFEHGLGLDITDQIVEAIAPTEDSGRDVVEALLGPGLLLLCARQGAFAVHASAVADARGIVLLAGPSGQGKSSLARQANQPVAGLYGPIQRVADDLVVLDHTFAFCSNIPQLKLDPILMPAPDVSRLRMIVWPEFDDGVNALDLRTLSSAEMRLRLIRDSVAARLFSASELMAHLDWVTRLSQHVPGFVVVRPRVDPALVGAANRHVLDFIMG